MGFNFVNFSLFSSSACVTELFTTSGVDETLAFIALLTKFTELKLVCFGLLESLGVAGLIFFCPANATTLVLVYEKQF